LKLYKWQSNIPLLFVFLYIDPIKQWLKLNRYVPYNDTAFEFLYIDPIKQGLKHYGNSIEDYSV